MCARCPRGARRTAAPPTAPTAAALARAAFTCSTQAASLGVPDGVCAFEICDTELFEAEVYPQFKSGSFRKTAKHWCVLSPQQSGGGVQKLSVRCMYVPVQRTLERHGVRCVEEVDVHNAFRCAHPPRDASCAPTLRACALTPALAPPRGAHIIWLSGGRCTVQARRPRVERGAARELHRVADQTARGARSVGARLRRGAARATKSGRRHVGARREAATVECAGHSVRAPLRALARPLRLTLARAIVRLVDGVALCTAERSLGPEEQRLVVGSEEAG